MGNFDSNYFSTRRGLIRIVMIIIGFAISSLLCNSWWGGRSCFNETRLGGVSAANFIFIVVNIVFFVLAILSITNYSFERLASLAGAIVFGICSAVMIWYIIQDGLNHTVILLPTALVVVQFFLFVWDWQILNGEAHN
ncbi:unnamed protein product, partial [Mesorhabditis belari]|uniref:Uncharacterized protein n=1 Tax=Mesorhabditis belari TaxID=2138241 RepID=A0AAF3EUV8_9BILA